MRLSRSALLASLTSLLLILATAVPTLSQQPPGQPYEGTHYAGGTVKLVVASNQVVWLELEGIAGGGCSWDTITLDNWGGPIPVTDNAFEARNADGDVFRGKRLDLGHLEGSVEVSDPAKGCSTGELGWTAQIVLP